MKKFLALLFIWALVLGGGAAAYHFLIADKGGESPNKEGGGLKVKLALDSFPGYCIFRSDEFKKKLAEQKIDIECKDDEADYAKRMETIKTGETPLAVFTIDALLNNTPDTGEPPATIIMLIDESRGADAMLGYQEGVANIDALNNPGVKVVFAENSPSEALLRVVQNKFNLPNFPRLKADYMIPAKDAEKVLEQFEKAKATERKAFILWEPYVSIALKAHPNAQILVDSSRFKGFIVDVLVVQQDFLRKHKDEVKKIVQTYLEILQARQARSGGMVDLVKSDLEIVGEAKHKDRANDIVKGIWWKNTLENCGHLGILSPSEAKGLQPISEMISNITKVLNETKQPTDPTVGVGRIDKLFEPELVRQIFEARPAALHLDRQRIREETAGSPTALTDDQWNKLRPVGAIKLDPIAFKGGDVSFKEGEGDWEERMAEVAENLKLFPTYYLRVEGNSRKPDTDDNRKLAQDRADWVARYLVEKKKVPAYRVKPVGMTPGGGKEVGFTFLEAPGS
jgi:outer membrane protein OmpA-like peptidoglycan-associated protein